MGGSFVTQRVGAQLICRLPWAVAPLLQRRETSWQEVFLVTKVWPEDFGA